MKTNATFHKGSLAIRRFYFHRTCSLQQRHLTRKAELIFSLLLTIFTIMNIDLVRAQSLVGSLDGGEPNDVVVVDTLAFVADEQDRLRVMDVANPSSPQLIGSLTPVAAENGIAIAVSGNYAYVAVEADGLLIIDISSSTKPSLVGQYRGAYAKDVAVTGELAYVADQDFGPGILHISDPFLIVLLSKSSSCKMSAPPTTTTKLTTPPVPQPISAIFKGVAWSIIARLRAFSVLLYQKFHLSYPLEKI